MIAFLREGWEDVTAQDCGGGFVEFHRGSARWERRRTERDAALLRAELVKAYPAVRFPDCGDGFLADLLSYRSQPPLRGGLPVFFYHRAFLWFLFG